MSEANWHGKPYYSLDAYLKNTYHHKCYKVALNAHMTCPNRDGTLGNRGCIFCSAGGSGDFAVDTAGKDIERQLAEGIKLIEGKLHASGKHVAQSADNGSGGACCAGQSAQNSIDGAAELSETPSIIAYFQAYTNTYAPVPYLREIFTQALSSPKVCGISIATRPDCLPEDILDLLAELKAAFPKKFIWIELGLQTIHKKTALYIRRGYELPCFERAMNALTALDIPVIVHVILGLPGETPEMMLETIAYLNRWNPFGVKLQLLHVLKDTDLATAFVNGEFDTLTKEDYLDILIKCLAHLSPDIVVHRVTGDGPKKLLISPTWSGNKRDVLNSLHGMMKLHDMRQGCDFSVSVETTITK